MATGSLKVDFQANTDELDRLRQDFANFAEEFEGLDIIEDLAEYARGQIIERTQAGRDFNEQPFRPYAGASFAQGRDSKGRFSKNKRLGSGTWAEKRERAGLPTERVNLTVTGTLMRAIDWKVKSPTLAELFIQPESSSTDTATRDEVAEGHQFGGRPWFGISDKQAQDLEKKWVAITLRAMLRRVTDARPVGSEVAQLNDGLKLVRDPSGPFSDYRKMRG